ncbi:hypothetical protein [Streptomyces sp. MBT53]|nr:hypothetical protein [Streptomyces sp. MBT53]
MTTLAIPTHRATSHLATGWDRAAILPLGTAACTLIHAALTGGK